MARSEEHTSELQSQSNLVCRLLLEKKNQARSEHPHMRQESHNSPVVGRSYGRCRLHSRRTHTQAPHPHPGQRDRHTPRTPRTNTSPPHLGRTRGRASLSTNQKDQPPGPPALPQWLTEALQEIAEAGPDGLPKYKIGRTVARRL